MDTQDHTAHTTHSGHDGHGVHLCHRCGWPFPNPHPSARHRRAHKKICGTIEGYTVLIGSEVVSDDEPHSDDDKEQTPSPKTDEIKGSVPASRSEDEFTDAVTEFADTGSTKKTLEKDLFLSFKDAENAELSKVDTITEVSETTDPHVEKTEETKIKTVGDSAESNAELTGTGELVKDGLVAPVPEPSHVSQSEAGEEKSQESQTSEIITEEAKDSEATKTTPEASPIVEEINQEMKSDCEPVSEVVKESEPVEEVKVEKSESDHNHVAEVAKESGSVENVSVLTEKVDLGEPNEQIPEVVKESVEVLTERKDLEAPELEKSSIEQIQEAVSEPVAVLIEKEDLGGPQLEKESIEHTHEVVEKPDTIVTEKDLCTPELKEVVKETDTVLTEKEDLGGPQLEKQSIEHAHEVIEKPDSILTEKQDVVATETVVEKPDSVLNENCSNDEVTEQKVNIDHNLVADFNTETVTVTLKDSSNNSVKDASSAVVPEPIVEESNGKLVNNQDSGAEVTLDSSSHNSLEGTWGSVSVLSTASTDAETLQPTEKSKVNSGKSNAATTDVVSEPSSLMTLVQAESKDNKSCTSEVEDSKPPPNSEASQVTNLNTGKQSTPLKNLLGEAKSPSGKQPEPVVQKDEPPVNTLVNDEASSPPKLIEDGKKGKKKGRSSWVPFVCCSSVNAVK